MKYIYSLLILFGSISVIAANQRSDAKLQKSIEKSFDATLNSELEITNKYGSIITHSWDQDSVKIVVNVSSYGKDEKNAQKQMDRVDFDFYQFKDRIIAETIFDRPRGFLKDLWSDLGDYSKKLMGSNKLQIDYDIYLPTYCDLKINNKFGDVFLDDIEGDLIASLSNGNFKAGEIPNGAELNLSFGKASLKNAQDLVLTLRSIDLDLDYAETIDIKSNASTITLGEVRKIQLESRGDRFKIEELTTMSGTASFAKIDIDILNSEVVLDMNYGNLEISQIVADFSTLALKGKSTDFDLNFDPNCHLIMDLTAKDHKLSVHEDFLKKEFLPENEKFVNASGTYGSYTGKEASTVALEADGGSVTIRFVK